MDFLIAYDICHPRRLRRVARLMEKHGVRTQYSVFLFQGERAALERLLDEAARLLKAEQDVIQAWPVGGDPTSPELVRGSARPVYPAAVVLSSRKPLVIQRLPETIPALQGVRMNTTPIALPVLAKPQALVVRNPALGGDVQSHVYHATLSAPRPLTALMTWLLDRRTLASAWERVAAADGADTPGADGLICSALKARIGDWLARLADDLYHRRYLAQPPRLVDIPRPDKPGATRRLGILNVRDRVVQAALKQVLEPVLDPTFLPTSFGFRPGRSTAAALDTAARALTAVPNGGPVFLWAVPLDVADCFPTIDHALLLGELARHVADDHLLRLIEQVIAAGGTTAGRLWWRRACGLVQGGALSPLLCNLALHPLDLTLAALGRETQGGVLALRYADDLLLLARDAALAKRGVEAVRVALKQRYQALGDHPEPRPVAQGVEWLGVRLQPRRLARPGRSEHGHVVPEAKVVRMLARLDEMTAPPSEKIDASAFNVGRWIVSVNNQLRDWRGAYLYADNAHEVFRVLDDHARERVGELLHSITGLSWPELRRRHWTRLPRGFWTWEVPGARLTVLSSLAPHAPARLIRRPSWMRRPTNDAPAPRE